MLFFSFKDISNYYMKKHRLNENLEEMKKKFASNKTTINETQEGLIDRDLTDYWF